MIHGYRSRVELRWVGIERTPNQPRQAIQMILRFIADPGQRQDLLANWADHIVHIILDLDGGGI